MAASGCAPRWCSPTCDALGGDTGDDGIAIRFALALELVHTYSLVHDDLPCMDDDDLRRGRPTVHKAHDEATAVLVGDGLQSLAFRRLLATPHPYAAPLAALRAEGAWRMVEGRALDLAAEGRTLAEGEILTLMARRTGALITAALVGGAVAATGASQGLEPVGRGGGLRRRARALYYGASASTLRELAHFVVDRTR